MPTEPIRITHIRRAKTEMRVRVSQGGDPLDLTNHTVFGGLEKDNATGSSSTSFRKFAVTAHGTHGYLSATIPYTGINFTGLATLRFFSSGSPRQFHGQPFPVNVVGLSSNWVP